jgi:hypothetical protein
MEYEYWNITVGARFRKEKLLIAAASLFLFGAAFLQRYGCPLDLGQLLLFVLFCNKYYNTVYNLISGKLSFVFWVAAIIIVGFCCLISLQRKKEDSRA